jgi:exosortase/archaeosortase family protein
VLTSSKFLSSIGYKVYFNENIISIDEARAVKIKSGCNFFEHLDIFLFFIISFPSNKKRMFKYIFICLFYLSFIQIFRIVGFVIYMKYFPQSWNTFHMVSSYLFYYPGIIMIWYFYSRKNYV